MPLVTLAQAKAKLQIAADYIDDDELIQDDVDSITAVIEEYKSEVIDPRTVVEERLFCGERCFVLRSFPAQQLTSVATVDGLTTWDVNDLHLDTTTGRVTVLKGPRLRGLVAFTYDAGYTTPPGRYVQAALIILQHNWESMRGLAGVQAGVLGEEELHQRAGASFAFPHKALEWLGSHGPVVA